MLRFTIRDVLWLTVAVALALGWGLNDIGWRAIVRDRENSAYKALERQKELHLKIVELQSENWRLRNYPEKAAQDKGK